jgi:uncharacterized protein YdaT
MGLFDFAMNIGKKLFDTASEVPAALKKLRYQMTKHNQHVVPHEGKWVVKAEGSDKPSSVHDTQEEAIHCGREFAHRLGTVLVIHDAHGRIEHQENITAAQVPAKKANDDQHVVLHEGKWAVKSAGSGKPTSVHNTQHEAIEHAREFAKKQGTILFIHAHDGHIRELHDYRK